MEATVVAELQKRALDFVREDVVGHAQVTEIRTFPMADGSARWATTVHMTDSLEEATYRIIGPAPSYAPEWAKKHDGYESDWLEGAVA